MDDRAEQSQEHGQPVATTTTKDHKNYQPILESLKYALWKQESNVGRYNPTTAQCYCRIGDTYVQMQQVPRAIVMHKVCFRINSFLYGACFGQISGTFRDLLEQRGLSPIEIRNKVLESMKFEIEGDLLRRYGEKKAAVREYQQALRVEEIAFGRDNPDLACLCRKVACLVAIRRGVSSLHQHDALDFDEADMMGHNSRWMQKAQAALHPSACVYIRKGDRYYESQYYSQAVAEYRRATAAAEHAVQQRKSKPSKDKHGRKRSKSPSSKKKKPTTEDMVKEIRCVLAGALPPRGGHGGQRADNNKRNVSTHKAGVQMGQQHNIIHFEERGAQMHQKDNNDMSGKSPRESFSNSEERNAPMAHRKAEEFNAAVHLRHSAAVYPSTTKKHGNSTTMEVSHDPALLPPTTPKIAAKQPALPPPSAGRRHSPEPSKHKNIPPSSSSSSQSKPRKHRRARESLSESSLLTTSFMKPPSYLVEKPKSDSYITKIAQKTTKIAKNHLKSQLQRSRSNSSKDKSNKSTRSSSFFSSLRKERTSMKVPISSSKDGGDESTNLPLTTSSGIVTSTREENVVGKASHYHVLQSPPPTPYNRYEQGSSQKNDTNFLQEPLDAQSASSFPTIPVPLGGSPSCRRQTLDVGGSSDNLDAEDSTIVNSGVFEQQPQSLYNVVTHPLRQRWEEPYYDGKDYGERNQSDIGEDTVEDRSNQPLGFPTESSSALLEQFMQGEEESNRFRFIDSYHYTTTPKRNNRTGNESSRQTGDSNVRTGKGNHRHAGVLDDDIENDDEEEEEGKRMLSVVFEENSKSPSSKNEATTP